MLIIEIAFPAYLLNGIASGAESDAQVNYVESSIRFRIDVTNLNVHCVESAIIELNHLNWSVKLCKTNNSAEWLNRAHNNVDLHLQCLPLRTEHAHPFEYEAIVKLLARDDRCNEPIGKRLSKREFRNSASTAVIIGFVDWNYFFNNFVSDDYATFEIDVRTSTTRREQEVRPREEQNFYEIGSRIHFMLDNVTNLIEEISPEITVAGIRWNVIVERRDVHLGVYLKGNEMDFEQNSAYKVTAHFKLLTYDRRMRPERRDFTHFYRSNSSKEGFEHFLDFNDFIDSNKHYTRENKANLLVEFTVEEQDSVPDVEYSSSEKFDCSACLKEFCSGDIYSANCGHLYCQPCFTETQQNSLVCPECGSSIRDGIHPIHHPNNN